MKVSIAYHDTDSLTVEEIVRRAESNYGKSIVVEITPESTLAYDHIYFGLQQLLTHEQISIFFDKGANYQLEIGNLRARVLSKVQEIVDQVIVDNEARVT